MPRPVHNFGGKPVIPRKPKHEARTPGPGYYSLPTGTSTYVLTLLIHILPINNLSLRMCYYLNDRHTRSGFDREQPTTGQPTLTTQIIRIM